MIKSIYLFKITRKSMKPDSNRLPSKFVIKTSYSAKSTSLFKGRKNTNSEPNLTSLDSTTQHTRETLASIDE